MSAAGIRFGPAGRGASFAAMGYRDSGSVPQWLGHFGLNAFEYQCGHGVRLNPNTGAELRRLGKLEDILYSVHAPYYISMASTEPAKREASLRYLTQSAMAADTLGGDRVIFHCGGGKGLARAEAMARIADALAEARGLLDASGLGHISLCPETMGRPAQFGTLDEVLWLCEADKRHIPCIDFGHLNAAGGGCLVTRGDYQRVVDAVGEKLGDERALVFHAHFSKIEYTAAGERRHLTFEDMVYGPPYEPLMVLCAEKRLAPRIICESAGTQAQDAKAMKAFYELSIRKI